MVKMWEEGTLVSDTVYIIVKPKKSDGGKTWKNKGLKESEHLSKIIVHPNDPNTVWVASQGPLWSSGGERGLLQNNRWWKTWNNTLEIDKNNDWCYRFTKQLIDPRDPDV